jgi:uncharacterized membrane protein
VDRYAYLDLDMIYWIIGYTITLGIYIVLDLLYINFLAKNFIPSQVGHLLASKPYWPSALVFYLLYTLGMVYFTVLPSQFLQDALFKGAFLGLLCYGTYELVNKSLLADWPMKMVVVDMVWGMVVTAMVSGLSWWAFLKLGIVK